MSLISKGIQVQNLFGNLMRSSVNLKALSTIYVKKSINQKLPSEKAAAVMKIVGTTEGAQMFPWEKNVVASESRKPFFLRS